MATPANIIDHVILLVDTSPSMTERSQYNGPSRGEEAVRVVDAQVADLKRQSTELNREIRVSVYFFDDSVRCAIFDMDVLRVPSINDLYKIAGRGTALCSAVMTGVTELETTSTIHGDHSFLVILVSDGEDNRSRGLADALKHRLERLPDRWTVVGYVPDQKALQFARKFGIPAGNLMVWDVTKGMEAVAETMRASTQTYLTGRQVGKAAATRSFFDTSTAAVNVQTVTAALKPLAGDKYRIIPVEVGREKVRVDEFIRDHCGMKFVLGTVYYQWGKRETVQPHKRLAVVNTKTDQVFVGSGEEIREMIGMPSISIRDRPKGNPDFQIYVQSTAPNRNLIEHTKALVLL
jgi:hypothetical protein